MDQKIIFLLTLFLRFLFSKYLGPKKNFLLNSQPTRWQHLTNLKKKLLFSTEFWNKQNVLILGRLLNFKCFNFYLIGDEKLLKSIFLSKWCCKSRNNTHLFILFLWTIILFDGLCCEKLVHETENVYQTDIKNFLDSRKLPFRHIPLTHKTHTENTLFNFSANHS